MNGFLIVDKPAGMTSHDVVNRVRRITGQKKAGHTGTLDPFATGVLPVALGEGTKAIPFLDESLKEYKAVIRLGISTDTQDCTGTVLVEHSWEHLVPEQVAEVVSLFIGIQRQCPPMYSAVKQKGTPLYKLARQGITVERSTREIHVHQIAVEAISLPHITITVRCSRGTYIRTLAHDIGDRLKCGAALQELRRTVTGPFAIDRALTLEQLEALAAAGQLSDELISPSQALANLVELSLTAKGAQSVSHGKVPETDDFVVFPAESLIPGMRVKLMADAKLASVAEITSETHANTSNFMRFLRVFN